MSPPLHGSFGAEVEGVVVTVVWAMTPTEKNISMASSAYLKLKEDFSVFMVEKLKLLFVLFVIFLYNTTSTVCLPGS